jgi:hypothetical protein
LAGLLDEPRPGAPRRIGKDEVAEIVRLTLEATPREATHWSLRSLAKAVGLAPSTIHRIWRALSLQPHRAEILKLSTDPLFLEKVRDIVDLYLSPTERAIVLFVDEKSPIQALDRTQPLLPMRPGQVERRKHDYTRHRTLSLFAALDTTGRVLGKCFARHRPRGFRAFLNVIDEQIRRGEHRSAEELEAAIANYIDAVNAKLKPFVWTKSVDDILARVKRCCGSILSAAQSSIATTSKSGRTPDPKTIIKPGQFSMETLGQISAEFDKSGH